MSTIKECLDRLKEQEKEFGVVGARSVREAEVFLEFMDDCLPVLDIEDIDMADDLSIQMHFEGFADPASYVNAVVVRGMVVYAVSKRAGLENSFVTGRVKITEKEAMDRFKSLLPDV